MIVIENYYFDTSMWLDIHEKRGYNGEVAKKLVEKIIRENKRIIYSDFIIKELKDIGYLDNEINKMLSIAKPNNLKIIHRTKKQISESVRIAKQRDVPLGDAIHAVLARDHEAQLVSRDPHFLKLMDITRLEPPENLL